MRGLSLGGGMIGEAILHHDFTEGLKKDIRYLVISDRSFSRLATVAGAITHQLVKPIFYLVGLELDGVAAARKLSHLNIEQMIIQHISGGGAGNDGVIPDNASLAYELHKGSTLKHKTFLESKSIEHNDFLPPEIEADLCARIEKILLHSN